MYCNFYCSILSSLRRGKHPLISLGSMRAISDQVPLTLFSPNNVAKENSLTKLWEDIWTGITALQINILERSSSQSSWRSFWVFFKSSAVSSKLQRSVTTEVTYIQSDFSLPCSRGTWEPALWAHLGLRVARGTVKRVLLTRFQYIINFAKSINPYFKTYFFEGEVYGCMSMC